MIALAGVREWRGRVLVVDGDGGFRAFVATVLEGEGYAVVGAETGEQAIRLAELDPPWLVVVGVCLPDGSGYRFCRVLRDRFGDDLPIVFVSGDRMDAPDRLAGLRVGADDFLEKPLAPAKLLIRVEKLIRRSNLRGGANVVGAGTAIPSDARFPQLTTLTDRDAAARALREVYGEPVGVLEVAVVRHQPGRRCTLRYELVRGRAPKPQRVYAKAYVSARIAGRVHRALSAAAATNAVRLPEPLGWSPRLRLVLQSRLEGKPATARLLAGDQALAARIAESAFALHTSGAKLESNHRPRHELAGLDARLARLPGDLVVRAQEYRDAAAAALTRARWRARPVHRDFHERQILVNAAGAVGLLDLDDAALSEPAVDVARFLARLRLLALKKTGSSAAVAAAAAAFRTRYASLDPQLDGRLVQALEATTLLRLACLELERGGRLAQELIDLSGAVLAEPVSRSRRRESRKTCAVSAPVFAKIAFGFASATANLGSIWADQIQAIVTACPGPPLVWLPSIALGVGFYRRSRDANHSRAENRKKSSGTRPVAGRRRQVQRVRDVSDDVPEAIPERRSAYHRAEPRRQALQQMAGASAGA
jgi:DNA-binding response OmpR family regulator